MVINFIFYISINLKSDNKLAFEYFFVLLFLTTVFYY